MYSLFHVDSKYASLGKPGSYRFNLVEPLRSVSKVEVVYGEVPSSMYAFNRPRMTTYPYTVDDRFSEFGWGRNSTNTCVVEMLYNGTYQKYYIDLLVGSYDPYELVTMMQAQFDKPVSASPNGPGTGSEPNGTESGVGSGNVTFAYAPTTHAIRMTRNTTTALKMVSFPGVTGMDEMFMLDIFNGSPTTAGLNVLGTNRVNLATPSMLFLVIKNLSFLQSNRVPINVDIPRSGHGQLARFQLTAPQGYMNYFSTEHLLEHGECTDACNNHIDHLDIEWVDRDGNVAEFNGIHHTLQLRIFHAP